MSSQYDVSSLYSFLLHTPESGLRKILVDQKVMTDVHFSLLMKIVKTCDEPTFTNHFTNTDFPKVKFGPAEMKIKEKFWSDCTSQFLSRGLLNPASGSKAA